MIIQNITAQQTHEFVESQRRPFFEKRVSRPVAANAIDNIIAIKKARHHLLNHRHIILQIGIDADHRIC